jgi:hypothetical protein
MKRAAVTLPDKYDEEADWTPAYRVAERAAEAGLWVTRRAALLLELQDNGSGSPT